MNKNILFIPLFLILACRTPAGTKEKNEMTTPTQAQPELLLQKIVGGIPVGKPQSQIFDCKIMAKDIADADHVRSLIDKLENTPLVKAYLFVAIDPSVEIFAYKGDKKILIYEGASSRLYPTPNNQSGTLNIEADELINILDEKCPTPQQK